MQILPDSFANKVPAIYKHPQCIATIEWIGAETLTTVYKMSIYTTVHEIAHGVVHKAAHTTINIAARIAVLIAVSSTMLTAMRTVSTNRKHNMAH